MEGIWMIAYIYVFIIGLCVASFMNVVIYRVPLEISVAKGRSFCPTCNHQLFALDLIPVISYMLLKGKCRYCHERISLRYPLLELSGGVMAVLCLNQYGFDWMTLCSFAFIMVLLCIAMIDLDTMMIPNGLVLCLVVLLVPMCFLMNDLTWTSRIIGFFAVSTPMLLLNALIPDCFGGGDIKLMAVCGFALGWIHIVLAMFIGIILCGMIAVTLLLKKKVERQMHIAFGPYLAIGIGVALLYGTQILTAYFSLFGR